MEDILLCVAPNGARLGKSDHPALPISPEELANCAEECQQAGAAMIHLHVRDDNHRHILDVDLYDDAITAIRERLGDKIVIQVTTEAVGLYGSDEQQHLVERLKPEAVSLALRELLPVGSNEDEFIQFWQWMTQEKIWPQIILYDEDDILRFQDMRTRGIFGTGHVSILCVLGRYGKGYGAPADLLPLYNLINEDADLDWSVCAFGPMENACIAISAALGGHARIGFENNHILANGKTATNNADLIYQASQTVKLLGRQPMDAKRLRSLRIKR